MCVSSFFIVTAVMLLVGLIFCCEFLVFLNAAIIAYEEKIVALNSLKKLSSSDCIDIKRRAEVRLVDLCGTTTNIGNLPRLLDVLRVLRR